MGLLRKRFLKLGASASFIPAFSTLPVDARTVLAAQRPAAQRIHREFTVTPNQVQSWIEWMSSQGPRYTGNPAHVNYINFLHNEFEAAGLLTQTYQYKFSRWDANSTALSMGPTGGASSPVTVSSYYVRSGQTPAGGVTAPLTYGGTADAIVVPTNANGSIVYLDFAMPPLSLAALFVPFGTYPTGTVAPTEINAGFSFIFLPGFVSEVPGMGELSSAGALGAIVGWTNISDAQAAYQYQPFTIARGELPTLFVPQSQTSMVRELALAGGTTASLTLDATIYENATTETLIATLPGMSAETIIINTHTDGPNVFEENGGVALLSIARYFARMPKSARQKTLVFVMATGHMDEPDVPSGMWIAQRPDIIANAVACVTIEHLGCQQWLDNASGTYAYTGSNDYGFAQTQNTGIANSILAAVQGTGAEPTVCGNPVAFFGLGEALNALNIPTNGFILGPAYLLTGSPNGEIDKMNFEYMYAQIDALTAHISALDGMTASEIAGTRVPVPSAIRHPRRRMMSP